MVKLGYGLAMGRLPATLMAVGLALLIAACGSGGGNEKVTVEVPVDPDPVMTDLGEWDTRMAGVLEVSDANSVLRAHYDESGVGHVMAATPVQPAGMGTATWTGRWSGKIEVNPDPLTRVGLGAYGVNPDDLAQLEGEAQVTAFFEDDGVKAELTYRDLGLDDIGLAEITSDRVPVTGGQFEPTKMYSHSFDAVTSDPFDPTAPTTITPTTVAGNFRGEGAFGGVDAAGVVGYVGGDVTIEYGRGPTNVGTFQSVFYGTRDEN